MKLAAYVADFIAKLDTRVYGVCGGGAMHLNDAICSHPGIKVVAMHHEQAASFAAEADARVTGKPAVVMVTAGPGVTNAMTGVACAYADSIPMIVIAGQVESRTLMRDAGIRQLGISEVDGVALMGPITKYAWCVTVPSKIRMHLLNALHYATSGRKGPVFLEIPLDVQNADIDPDQIDVCDPQPEPLLKTGLVDGVAALLRSAQRPVILLGNGVRLAGAADAVVQLSRLGIPVLCSWGGADLIASANDVYIGRPGLIGDRAGNFAIQNADVILAIGTRLSIPQIGHAYELFAPRAKLIVVDNDPAELRKPTLRVDVPVLADAKEFLSAFVQCGLLDDPNRWAFWLSRCQQWKSRYPVIEKRSESADGVDVYQFLDVLGRIMDDDAIVVTDVGQAFVCTMQALAMSGKQRMFHSPGIAPMGYGLPAAVGACIAGGNRQTICIAGDGGTMFNLQELQTIVHHKLPITIFLLANNGYRTMQVTQGNHFGREAVSSAASGVSWPDYVNVAKAFGVEAYVLRTHEHVEVTLQNGGLSRRAPILYRANISSAMTIAPLVKTKVQDNKFVPAPIDDMWPYLDRVELEEARRA